MKQLQCLQKNQKKTKNQNVKKRMCQKMLWKSVKLCCQYMAKPCPRWGHSSCVIADIIVIFGGYANSVYMNDLWCFNTSTMKWQQIKTGGKIPLSRSNCSLNYDEKNKRLIVFGGGGHNKTRFNDVHYLNWETKQWSYVHIPENKGVPEQRTYHSASLLYPYLVVFGGEGVTDLDDLWVLNIQKYEWRQIGLKNGAVRPSGRRFHSTCVINKEFFVIAGCYSKYKPLNSVFSIDLRKLEEEGKMDEYQWKQIVLNQQSFLTRWGQSIAVQNNNIYIFGGRFINDLNDLLVIDGVSNKLKVLKIANQSIPKPRRKSVLGFVGNCLIMFGGFNNEYFNDLYYINITQNMQKTLCYHQMVERGSINKKQQDEDIEIQLQNGKIFYCPKEILIEYFSNEWEIEQFIKQASFLDNEDQFKQFAYKIFKQNDKNSISQKYFINLLENKLYKNCQYIENNQLIKNKKYYHENYYDLCQQIIKNHINNNISIYDESNNDDQHNADSQTDNDIIIKINKTTSLASKIQTLTKRSKYFKNMLSPNYKQPQSKQIQINWQQVIKSPLILKIIIKYLQHGHLFIPRYFYYHQIIYLYKICDYLALNQIKNVILNQIYFKINQKSVNTIFCFANQYQIQDLAIACCRYNYVLNPKIQINENNKYMKISYEQNRFEIKQNLMIKKQQPLILNKNQFNCQDGDDQKQNVQKY